MNKILLSSIAALALAAPVASATETIAFTYNTDNQPVSYMGLNVIDTYDMAIRISEPTLRGFKVVGMEVPVNFSADDVTDLSAWMSTSLKLSDGVNAPSQESKAATIENGKIKVMFDTPYTLTATGIYVGYSFAVKNLNQQTAYPMPTINAPSNRAGYLHVPGNQNYSRWTNIALDGIGLDITVFIEGDFEKYGMTAALNPNSYAIFNSASTLNLDIVNTGASAINNVTYKMTIGGKESSGVANLETPLTGYQVAGTVSLPTPAMDQCGYTDVKVTISAINGVELTTPIDVEGQLAVISHLPVRRPLVEEYTGLWCGACPAGYVILEQYNEQYGDEFVALAYHNSDDMATINPAQYPSSISSYPTVVIDRKESLHPLNMPGVWEQYTKTFSPADINVSVAYGDAERTTLVATSTTEFVMNVDNADYSLEYVLVGDDMSGDDWAQSNYYSGDSPTQYPGELWRIFINGGSYIAGLHFNDVVLARPDRTGIAGSVPATIVMNEKYTHTKEFSLTNIQSLSRQDLLPHTKGLHVVAILRDAKGNILNCAKSANVSVDGASVGSILDDNTEVISTTYFDLQGREVKNPAAGQLLIKRDNLSNGAVRHNKTIIR